MSILIAGHSSKSQFIVFTKEGLYFVQLQTVAINAYLKGEVYSKNLVHFEIEPEFLKKPEKMMRGMTTIGMTVLTDFASWIIEPKSRPAELPAKQSKKRMKQQTKNCQAVPESPIIQQAIKMQRAGQIMRQGISMIFLLKKQGTTLYILEFYYLRNTSLYSGKTKATGIAVWKKISIAAKKKHPVIAFQYMIFVQSVCPIFHQRPPISRARKIAWNILAFRIIGFLTKLTRSLLMRVLSILPQLTSQTLLTIVLVSRFLIYQLTIPDCISKYF